MSQRAEKIRELLKQETTGVLSTLSHKHDGWPFGSLTPFALTDDGEPIILVSGLAEHTKNMEVDQRVSLFVSDSKHGGPAQSGARATILAKVEPVPAEQLGEACQRYLKRFPDSAGQFSLGDFYLLRLRIEHIRYIAGFGSMFWMPGREYLGTDNEMAKVDG